MSVYPYPPTDSYPTQPSSAGVGDVDVFSVPPNLRSMSMTEPIVDPDFGWFDSFPAQFSGGDFESSPSSGSASTGGSEPYDWYDPLPAPAQPQPPPPPPPPPHAHGNGHVAGQPAHGLAPIIPPQQRIYPLQPQQNVRPQHLAKQADWAQQPYAQPPSRPYQQPQQQQQQHQPPQQQQQSALYEQPPQFQHSASFPPPSYPPLRPPTSEQQQQQLVQPFNRRASSPSTAQPPSQAGGTPGPYASHKQSMDGAGDYSPVSHVSSISSTSSSSSSDNGADGARQQKRKHSADGGPADANGLERSPLSETTSIAKGRGRGGGKKQRSTSAQNGSNGSANGSSKAKANAKTPPTSSPAPAAAVKLKGEDSSTAALDAATTAALAPHSGFGWCGDGHANTAAAVVSVEKSAPLPNEAWPVQTSTYTNMQNYFVSLILAMKTPDTQNVTDVIHLIAHAMEVAPVPSFTSLLRRLGYVPQPAPAAAGEDPDNKRVVWRSPNALLPFMTLPHHFRLNWSVSPDTTPCEDTATINFPMLMWWRAKEVRFVRRADGSVQAIETSFHSNPGCTPAPPLPTGSPHSAATDSATPTPTPTPQTPATPSTEPASPAATEASSTAAAFDTLPPSAIDMSQLDLPCHVCVNSAFERMFGYSQSEIRILFMRHGKQALARLADAAQFRACHELAMREACEGQHEFSHVIDVRPKYGGSMKTLMHHKLVVGNEGLVWKKLYCWIPLTKSMKDAYVATKQAGANGAAARTGGWTGELPRSDVRLKVGNEQAAQ